jgi:NitT/TauT family transport system substrate-binding protein
MRKMLVALLTIFALHGQILAEDKIRIGIPDPTAGFITFPLAQKKGFLKEEGLEAEIIRVDGAVMGAALSKGEIDYSASLGSTILGALRGLPLKAVANYAPSTYTLIAQPEYKSVQDLKGKTIGIVSFGHGTEIIARIIFRHFGLDPEKDIRFVPLGNAPARRRALTQGLIAATLELPPGGFVEIKQGVFSILARAHEIFSFPQSSLAVHSNRIKDNPNQIKRVIKAGIKANRYLRENSEGTIQFLMERQKIDREIATTTHAVLRTAFNDDGALPEAGLRLVIEERKKFAKVDREVAFSEVADLSILREAQRELGIKEKN